MDRAEFLAFARTEVESEYGIVPVGVDDALERIADQHQAEVERLRILIDAAYSRARSEAGAW